MAIVHSSSSWLQSQPILCSLPFPRFHRLPICCNFCHCHSGVSTLFLWMVITQPERDRTLQGKGSSDSTFSVLTMATRELWGSLPSASERWNGITEPFNGKHKPQFKENRNQEDLLTIDIHRNKNT